MINFHIFAVFIAGVLFGMFAWSSAHGFKKGRLGDVWLDVIGTVCSAILLFYIWTHP